MKILKPTFLLIYGAIIFNSCGSANVIPTPIENTNNLPLKVSEISEQEKKVWSHLDLIKDTIPGMSVEKAYSEIIKNRKGETVIVAVIDSGIDIEHEDLAGVIWTNEDEVPNNGKDDDGNGYVDDIHGWNFLGDGYDEQVEYVRILAKGDLDNPDYARAQREYIEERNKYTEYKSNYEQIIQSLNYADETISKHLEKKEYSIEEINAIETENRQLQQSVYIINYLVDDLELETVTNAKNTLKDDLEDINNWLDVRLNKSFKGRKTGDDPDDLSQKFYGNGNIMPIKKSESHGTHVAGIIAAERKNGIGIDGVANNVKIMSLRAVSNADEYDKDIALAIRYAVDNGAKIINGSFGKYYSPHPEWVKDAIIYAGKHDVLFVHGSGNESIDLDKKNNYPNDQFDNGSEISNNFINVGSIESKYGSGLVSAFSNYGKLNVDVMAPGGEIYSTMPKNEYKAQSGTSMSAPSVSGVAALIRSYYPKLTASQVKHLLMDSGVSINLKVIVGGNTNDIRPFSELSKSGKIVNAYNALIMADQISKN
ncbi:S8 family peptidase [Yeosuana sp. MJ-SS3]|uniref:S8 family peptidase n=1 Tax=Gilvirhabdus luticola TaxID=3079858 RepID=A0ABU3U2S7_9FLAO|nr:S8 family peptidase [Yeosuana sp. MJ-SS3]MDU8884707.1 S8 family peptidase [Yeosuana sp. MJ-SS3]